MATSLPCQASGVRIAVGVAVNEHGGEGESDLIADVGNKNVACYGTYTIFCHYSRKEHS